MPKILIVNNMRQSITGLIKLGIILLGLGWAILYSLSLSINIPTFHLDGAFQTASGLYRLDAGQFPGKDFYPYLGIGPLYSIYPLFKIFGANISASVFSAQLMVLIVGMLSTAFIWHLIWQPKTFFTSLVAGSILFLAPIEVASYFSLPLPNWLMFDVSPGNSLRPIRAAAPYLVGIIYYFSIFRITIAWIKYLFAGLLTGSILLWSNDFALPSAGLLSLFIGANALRCNEFKISNMFVYLISTIASWMAFLTLSTHGHPIELLQYNFLDVAKDQWWFFGPYAESTRIFSLQQLTRLFTQENYFPSFALLVLAIFTLAARRLEHALLLWIGTVLFAGGAVASGGGNLGGYFGGFYFWGMMFLLTGLLRIIWLYFKNHTLIKYKLQVHSTLALIFLTTSVFLFFNSLSNLKSEISIAHNDPNRFFVPELGGYLGKEWYSYINLARDSKEAAVFEEYWGLWSATRKSVSNWPVDSVIHALGRTRETASKGLKEANVIISTKYSTSPNWQPWILSQNYWFYENLLRDWTPSFFSPTTIVWHKSEHSRTFKNVVCSFTNNEYQSLIIQANEAGFYEINMQYNIFGSGRYLAMVKNNISFGADAGGYVSIDPKGKRITFPVYVEKSGPARLDIKIIGIVNNNVHLEIKSCSAKYIPPIDREALRVPVDYDDTFFLTDNNWVAGVARNWAGFFVPNTHKFADEYKTGKFVKFANGEIREITRVVPSGIYLNIYLSGESLATKKVGLPTQFKVIENIDPSQKEVNK